MTIVIRSAEQNETPLLAEMNTRLVEDQGSENTWSLAQYEQRFVEWLRDGSWQLEVILDHEQRIGAGSDDRGDAED